MSTLLRQPKSRRARFSPLFVFVLPLWPLLVVSAGFTQAADSVQSSPDIEVFASKRCPHCTAAKLFLMELRQERPSLEILIRDVDEDKSALARLEQLSTQFGYQTVGVPTFYLRGELVIGFAGPDTTGRRIKALLDRPPPASKKELPEGACLPGPATPCEDEPSALPPQPESVETSLFGPLSVQEMGLPVFTLALGLLDGFNPCAMWVLLFLLSLLVNLHDRAKMALIASTFVVVSGLAYFAFMAAWLNVFLIIGFSRAIQLVLGGIAFTVGAVNTKDFFAFGRGPSLKIPETAKPGLYEKMRRIVQAENLTGALVGIVVLAVMVNMVELLCTAGFPAVYTHILSLQHLTPWEYYGYLGLYNVAYIVDDAVMVTIAVITLGHRKFQEKEGRWLKLMSGVVMLALGAILIAKPEWLTV